MSFEPQKCTHGTVVQEIVNDEPITHQCPKCLEDLKDAGFPTIGDSLDDLDAFFGGE